MVSFLDKIRKNCLPSCSFAGFSATCESGLGNETSTLQCVLCTTASFFRTPLHHFLGLPRPLIYCKLDINLSEVFWSIPGYLFNSQLPAATFLALSDKGVLSLVSVILRNGHNTEFCVLKRYFPFLSIPAVLLLCKACRVEHWLKCFFFLLPFLVPYFVSMWTIYASMCNQKGDWYFSRSVFIPFLFLWCINSKGSCVSSGWAVGPDPKANHGCVFWKWKFHENNE